MRLQLMVSWPNAGSRLLPESGAGIDVLADGRRLSPLKARQGERVFEVPDGTKKVRLIAAFWATLGAVSGTEATSPVSAEVLHVDQTYTVKDGTQLMPDPIGAFGGPHPLAVLKGVAGTSGAASISLRTEFVDISAFWSKYASFWDYYTANKKEEAELNKGTGTQVSRLVPLGYTGGSPIVWFASFPERCMTSPLPDVSCLVFFRPANHYSYTRVDERHDMGGLLRYLLAPLDRAKIAARARKGQSADWPELDHMTPAPDMSGRNILRCGFEKALVDSLRSVVMLHPWPSGSDFGVAQTDQLPSLCESALRYLWARAGHRNEETAEQSICKNVGNVRLGRLGLSAYSRGGLSLWPALEANMRRVDELYAFDCNGTNSAGGKVAQWYTAAAKDPRLRMVGGAYNTTTHEAILRTLGDIDGVRGERANVTLALRDPKWWSSGRQDYWEYVIRQVPFVASDLDTQHQFAVFGGRYGPKPEEGEREVETFLNNFLANSGFNRQ